MRSRSRTRRSTPTLGKSLESAASAEVHTPQVHQELKRTRECRERRSLWDRKVARRCSHSVAAVERVLLHAREDHPIDRRQLIRSGKLWRTRERVRSFVDRNKTCT